MERRNALKSMAMLIGGAVALPEWANAWSANSITAKNWLRPNLASVLSEAVETIIPKTSTPGAKDLGLDTFVQKMVADCYSKEVQSAFAKGIGIAQLPIEVWTRYGSTATLKLYRQAFVVVRAFAGHIYYTLHGVGTI